MLGGKSVSPENGNLRMMTARNRRSLYTY